MSELVIKDKLLFSLADKRYYESLTKYTAQRKDFQIGLERRLPADWSMHRHDVWTHCTPPQVRYPDQGWKIHLSATLAHAPAILATAATILIEQGVAFKFLSDRLLLSLSLGKRWSRGGSGKFMAIYPAREEQCAALLEQLHQATIGFQGPYILSDRRYRDSRVVYYRYGGLRGTRRMGPDGKQTLVITDQQGQYVEDERTPYFRLPPGIEDPFASPAEPEQGEPGTLKRGRYKIDSVLTFSNSGGVYLATDRESGATVVIKEARPCTNISSRGLDAVQLLKKEQRVLACLADTGLAPKPLDFFFDWEHAYLVEDYLEGARDFRGYMSSVSLALRTRATQAYAQEFYDRYIEVMRQLTAILQELHRRHIVFGDLSMANVMVTPVGETGDIKVQLIDFEGAHESDVDLPTHLFTPGFNSEEISERGVTAREDDLYALGSLMLAGLFPMNQLIGLDRRSGVRFLDALTRDFGLPEPLRQTIAGLMARKDERITLEQAAAALQQPWRMPAPAIDTSAFDSLDHRQYLERILRYIDHAADPSRQDRLFPSDPELFSSNPISLAYGACGVALVQLRARGRVDPAVLDWIAQVPLRRDAFSPGLYSGLAGVAWFWLEAGDEQRARAALACADDHPYLAQAADVFHGTAGWGMAQLRFYRHFGERKFLKAAIAAGERLLAAREQVDAQRCLWRGPETLSAGYAHGAAGICTFLLYLSLASNRAEFRKVGEQGLAWVASQALENSDAGYSWVTTDKTPSVTPYWRWGSSGIGRAVIRYWHVTGKEEYAELIDRIVIDADRKYAIFPGYFFGLAGIGELFLDLARFPRWRAVAEASLKRLFSGCLLYGLESEHGVAFPGESLARISCDLGTGSAGVALVLHRYIARDGAPLMLDELLPGWSATDR